MLQGKHDTSRDVREQRKCILAGRVFTLALTFRKWKPRTRPEDMPG